MSEQALILVDYTKLSCSATEAANAAKELALNKSALIGRVANAEEQQLAVAAQMDLERVKRTIEKAEEAVKGPLNTLRAAIIQTRKDFVADIESEGMRLAGLVNEFQCQERERVAAERRAAEAELQKIAEAEAKAKREAEEKAQAELRRIAEIERKAREEAEVKARAEREAAAKIKDAEARKQAQEQAAKRAQEEQRRIEAQAAANRETVAETQSAVATQFEAMRESVAVAEPVRVRGQSVRTEWKIEVTDIHLLYRAHSICVKLEPCITEIKALLDAGVEVKGVRASKEVQSGVRLGRERKAIEA